MVTTNVPQLQQKTKSGLYYGLYSSVSAYLGTLHCIYLDSTQFCFRLHHIQKRIPHCHRH